MPLRFGCLYLSTVSKAKIILSYESMAPQGAASRNLVACLACLVIVLRLPSRYLFAILLAVFSMKPTAQRMFRPTTLKSTPLRSGIGRSSALYPFRKNWAESAYAEPSRQWRKCENRRARAGLSVPVDYLSNVGEIAWVERGVITNNTDLRCSPVLCR